jgi:lipoate-protein ligase B
MTVIDLGLTDYIAADKIQRDYLDRVKRGVSENALILAEFFKVITMGRKGTAGNLLVSRDFLTKAGVEVYDVDRGGDITAHNEGQLVAYPVINLSGIRQDVHWYIRFLEEAVIGLLSEYGILGEREPGYSGVWVNEKKIAFIGIAISRWTSYHGLSLNVNNDLSIFDYINPCGIKGCRVTSVAKLKGGAVDMKELKNKIIEYFAVILRPDKVRPKDLTNVKTAAVA